MHGAVQGDYWVSNDGDTDGAVWVGADPKSSQNVSIFEP